MVLLYVFGAVALINCSYYFLFSKFSLLKNPDPSINRCPTVSLIVCAKNEAENLEKHIPLWLEQEHPNFEIILINDASSDETLAVMQQFAQLDSRIQIVNVKNNEAFWGNKKYALTLGIKRAKNNLLVFTDADCRPSSHNWLSIMASQFSEDKQIILGYGAYEKEKGFLNKIIRFETLMTAVQYFSYAQSGMPYMGVGRNLAYTSTVFYEVNGFIKHIKIASGDDDLFINEAATSTNTAICTSLEAFTYSIPKKTWKQWIRQKKRHYSTARLYKSRQRYLLGLYYLMNLLFWSLAVVVLFTHFWLYGIVIIGLRLLFQFIAIGKAAEKLQEKDLVALIPLLELFLLFTQLSIFISKSDDNNTRWK